ncbi:MAG: roadblock/LC7 domain-containing protein [Promethearchaeota archaeon]
MASNQIEQLLQLLKNFEAENRDIKASSIVSIQGLPICSTLGKAGDAESKEGLIAAMVAAILSVSDRAVAELIQSSSLKRILLESNDGLIIIQQAGPHSVLAVLVESDKQLGLIFMLMEALSKRIANILG